MSFSLMPLKEVALGIYDGPHATPKESDSGHIFLGIKNVTPDGRVDFSEIKYVSDEEFPKWTRRVKPTAGDVVFSYEATLHRYALIPEDFDGCLGRRMGLVRPDPNKLNPRYLHYYFLSGQWRAYADTKVIVGATVNRLPIKDFPDFLVSIPPIELQEKIVDVLGQYDDLIKNNLRRIQLLEESACLLYKEWFVQLRFPGHEHVKIVDGVPEGWIRKSVGSILGKVKRKGKVKSEDYLANGLLACVDQSRDFIGGYIDDLELAIKEELPVVVFGDHTRVVKYVDFPFAPGADGTQILIPNSDEIPRVFFYFLIAGINLANAFYARHFKFLKAMEVLIPSKKLMRLFDDSVSCSMDQISLLREQNKKLAQARDILLPRLLNGELAA